MYCSRSNWDSNAFCTSYMISIDKFDGRSEFPSYKVEDEDWKTLLEFKDNFWCQDVYDEHMARFASDAYKSKERKSTPEQNERFAKFDATKYGVPFLNQEVIDWLNENVMDAAKPYEQPANGWCMGDDSYRASGSSMDFALFFHRRKDAMAFVKRWSVHKKCTTYFDYFKEIRKELIGDKLVKVQY